MSLRKLPEIKAQRSPVLHALDPDPEWLNRWDAGIHAQAEGEATISILDVIGADMWSEGGITSKRIAGALRSIGDRDVTVHINSPGGDFFEGVAIYNALRAHKGQVTVQVLGLAASAASVIAMAGDRIEIGKAGFLMVHNAWVMAIGNRHDLAEAAKTMEPFDSAMATVYADRAGVEKTEAAGWMDAETWFNGEEAVEAGLADDFLPADAIVNDKARAEEARPIKARREIDARLARTGLPRSKSRALWSEAAGGTRDAALTVTQDADVIAGLQALRATIGSRSKP
jgi:ATP-dependent protease ClpP protease subunit